MKFIAYTAMGLWAFGCFTVAAHVHAEVKPSATEFIVTVLALVQSTQPLKALPWTIPH